MTMAHSPDQIEQQAVEMLTEIGLDESPIHSFVDECLNPWTSAVNIPSEIKLSEMRNLVKKNGACRMQTTTRPKDLIIKTRTKSACKHPASLSNRSSGSSSKLVTINNGSNSRPLSANRDFSVSSNDGSELSSRSEFSSPLQTLIKHKKRSSLFNKLSRKDSNQIIEEVSSPSLSPKMKSLKKVFRNQ